MLISNGPPTGAQLALQGAVLTLQVEVPAAMRQALQQAGQPVPAPRAVQGLIDTGASITGVADAILQGLGLTPIRTVTLNGVGGPSPHGVYMADLHLPLGPQRLSFQGRQMVGFHLTPPYEALIGRDLLQMMQLTYHGPHGIWTLAF